MTDHAEEKREKAKYDAEVSVTNMNYYPIQIIHECSPNLIPDRLLVPMLDKVKVEYIRMDEHEHLIREARAKECEECIEDIRIDSGPLTVVRFKNRAKMIREGKE